MEEHQIRDAVLQGEKVDCVRRKLAQLLGEVGLLALLLDPDRKVVLAGPHAEDGHHEVVEDHVRRGLAHLGRELRQLVDLLAGGQDEGLALLEEELALVGNVLDELHRAEVPIHFLDEAIARRTDRRELERVDDRQPLAQHFLVQLLPAPDGEVVGEGADGEVPAKERVVQVVVDRAAGNPLESSKQSAQVVRRIARVASQAERKFEAERLFRHLHESGDRARPCQGTTGRRPALKAAAGISNRRAASLLAPTCWNLATPRGGPESAQSCLSSATRSWRTLLASPKIMLVLGSSKSSFLMPA